MCGSGPADDNRLDDTVGGLRPSDPRRGGSGLSQIRVLPRRLLVRCDIGPSYGVGHLMRCVALAEEYAARDFEVVFSADVESVPFARDQLRRRGFRWVRPPDSTTGLAEQARDADVVVIDSYALPLEAYVA